MVVRAIVRDPDTHAGRWRFDGTTIFIDEPHRDCQCRGEAIRLSYQKLGPTHDEIDAALTFVFPGVREPAVAIEYIGLMVHCACGIHRSDVCFRSGF